MAFALTSAFLVGTLGLAAEWWWSGVFMPMPQPFSGDSMTWLIPIGTVAALGGGLLATWHVARLEDTASPEPVVHTGSTGWRRQGAGLAGIAIFMGLMGFFAPPSGGPAAKGEVTFTDVEYADGTVADECDGQSQCTATVTVKFDKADAVDDNVWFYALAWQGRGPGGKDNAGPRDPLADVPGVVRVEMHSTGTPGEYRSEHPLPLYGNWKTMLRLHRLPTEMSALPLHFPEDPAITSARGREILVQNGDVVDVKDEKPFLQREQKDDVPDWMYAVGYALVISSWIALILFFGWCYASAASGPAEVGKKTVKEPAPV
jgi:hypothetical protein